MYIYRRVVFTLVSSASLILAVLSAASAAEIKVLSSGLMRSALEELSGVFERVTGNKLTISYATGSAVKERILKGEVADLAILPISAMEDLQKQAKAEVDSLAVGGSLIAVSVRAGAPKPDIASVDSLKRSLLAATSIVYFDPASGATSGIHFAGVLERLGISQEMRPKTKLVKFPGPGPAEIVAKGEAELGISQPAEILRAPGAELVRPLPAELQNRREFVYHAAVLVNAKEPAAARAFIQFLVGPDATMMIKKKGLDPG